MHDKVLVKFSDADYDLSDIEPHSFLGKLPLMLQYFAQKPAPNKWHDEIKALTCFVQVLH